MKKLIAITALCFLAETLGLAQQPVNRTLSCSAASGSGSAYSCAIPVAPSGYVAGQQYRFKSDVANTGATTINFNSLGPVSIKKVGGGITTALVANDIQAGQWVYLTYDGTNMQMASQLGNASSGGGITTIVFNSPLTGGTITTSGTVGCQAASASQAGCLSSTDWSTFNSKQASLTFPLSVANGGTGTASPGLVQGTNITITGSWPNQTITASATAATAFSALTSSTNTTAAMIVGTGASIGVTGSGTIAATSVPGAGITGANSVPASTLPLATTGAFGAVKCDGSTITCTAGVIASIGGGGGFRSAGTLSSLPATCTPGTGVYEYFATDQPAGQQLYQCSSTNTWTQIVNLGGSGALAYTSGSLDITSAVPLKSLANTYTALNTYNAGVRASVVTINSGNLLGAGTTPTISVTGSGCSIGTLAGTNLSGTIPITGGGSCTFTLTATVTAPAHFFCAPLQDRTSGVTAVQASDTAQTATFRAMTVTTSDVLQYGACTGF